MKRNLLLKDKVVVVTGSSRGIGRAIAIEAARSRADIVISYNKQVDSAESVADEIRKLGRRALSLQVDVSSRVSVQKMISRALKTFGRIDVLINNAGVLQQKPFLEITDEDWERMTEINLKGTFICSQEVFPIMQKQGEGIIVNMASSGGQLGGPLAIHYSASKAGVICLTKSLARIGASYGIRVNCIA
ncbi:MAG: SDR family NAD(P)-dependent oxidoreductase, partial [Anaerolineales bacterium]|nr:SDR family NAD(P)-dependent oxidoreductase [Anaerolineales bacterium]